MHSCNLLGWLSLWKISIYDIDKLGLYQQDNGSSVNGYPIKSLALIILVFILVLGYIP